MDAEQERKLDSFVNKEVHCLCNEVVEQLRKSGDYISEAENISISYPEFGADGLEDGVCDCRDNHCEKEEAEQIIEPLDKTYLQCEDCFDPDPIEALQFFIITDWLADRLIEKGEMVSKDLAGLTVWGRTTCGQAISMDSVIQDIYNKEQTLTEIFDNDPQNILDISKKSTK